MLVYSMAVTAIATCTSIMIASRHAIRRSNEALKIERDAHRRTEKNRKQERRGRVRAEQRLRSLVTQRVPAESDLNCALNSIGDVVSCFEQCQGVPRQACLVPDSVAILKFKKNISPTIFDGLDEFSHVWIVFVFHHNTDMLKGYLAHEKGAGHSFRAKIKPPRANGRRVGVFATRTPHRPNPIGLTLGKIARVDPRKRELVVTGIDLVDGTPVLDIKPYLPMFDAVEASTPTWVQRKTQARRVVFESEDVRERFLRSRACEKAIMLKGLYESTAHVCEAITQVLAADVGRKPRKLPYTLRFAGLDVSYFVKHASLLTSPSLAAKDGASENYDSKEIVSVVISITPSGTGKLKVPGL